MNLFSDLINSKKIGKITICPLQIPELSNDALKLVPRLTRKQFSKLLEKYIAMGLNKAMNAAPLVQASGTFSYRKVQLDKLVEAKIKNFWRLFVYAANNSPSAVDFEAEFCSHVTSLNPELSFNDFKF